VPWESGKKRVNRKVGLEGLILPGGGVRGAQEPPRLIKLRSGFYQLWSVAG